MAILELPLREGGESERGKARGEGIEPRGRERGRFGFRGGGIG